MDTYSRATFYISIGKKKKPLLLSLKNFSLKMIMDSIEVLGGQKCIHFDSN